MSVSLPIGVPQTGKILVGAPLNGHGSNIMVSNSSQNMVCFNMIEMNSVQTFVITVHILVITVQMLINFVISYLP